MKCKITFYFKNGSTFDVNKKLNLDSDELSELERSYINSFEKGETIMEVTQTTSNIIDLKQVQIIKMEIIGDKDERRNESRNQKSC